MKNNILFIVILLSFNVFGQCPSGDVFLMTQEEVDNFIIDYPDCTELNDLYIGDMFSSDITNLNGLINLWIFR